MPPKKEGDAARAQRGTKSKPGTFPEQVQQSAIERRHILLKCVGITKLMTHQWSEKAKAEMRAKQKKKPRTVRPTRKPEEEFEAAKYKMPDGRDAFPSRGIKKSLISASGWVRGITEEKVKGGIFINYGEPLVPIIDPDTEGPVAEPEMREDMVRVGGRGKIKGTADFRYRPEYDKWGIIVKVEYDAGVFSLEQILALFQRSGFSVGLGDDRPECQGGDSGRFEVAPTIITDADAA